MLLIRDQGVDFWPDSDYRYHWTSLRIGLHSSNEYLLEQTKDVQRISAIYTIPKDVLYFRFRWCSWSISDSCDTDDTEEEVQTLMHIGRSGYSSTCCQHFVGVRTGGARVPNVVPRLSSHGATEVWRGRLRAFKVPSVDRGRERKKKVLPLTVYDVKEGV